MIKKISLWKLNKLPLTEQYGVYSRNFNGIDNELVIDKKSGLVSLKKKISPKFLYKKNNYTYKTSFNSKKKDIEKFIDFIKNRVNKKKIIKVVDIGANDITILKNFNNGEAKLYAIDPVIKMNKIPKNFFLIKNRIENLNLKKILKNSDLVILRHTLEHISYPSSFMKKLFLNVSNDTNIAIEVPNFDLALKKKRLDTIIHQHYHYFDRTTLSNLIIQSGGDVNSFINYNNGPCGGSMMFLLKKSQKKKNRLKTINIKNKIYRIKKTIKNFTLKMRSLKYEIEKNKKIYGYGAGLMLPTFIYHLGINENIFHCILDDDPTKNNLSYKNLNVKIKSTRRFLPKPFQKYLITSLENNEKIRNKINNLKPKKIYSI